MKKIIRTFIVTAGIAFLVCACALGKAEAAQTVKVRIAPYYTEIDTMSVYNPAVEYPVLTYKDVTYLPMTYDLGCRLGLAVGFEAGKGMFVTKHEQMVYYSLPDGKPFGGDAQNLYGKYYSAVIPEYPVYVNGISYNSSKEEYPFLNFRGVTYFPMTYSLAVEEMNFDISFSKDGFYLNRGYKDYHAQQLTDKSGNIIILKQRTGRDSFTDALGQERTFLYSWWERYRLHSDEFLEHLGTHSSLAEFSNDYYNVPARVGENENIYSEKISDTETAVYYKGEIIDTYRNIIDHFGREYIYDNVTFLYVNTVSGTAPAPYTTHCEYLYAKTPDGIKKLSWDERNNLTNVFADGNGGYYLCSDSYSPAYTSRWSNEFSAVYHWRSDGSFCEVTVPDTNSVRAYGVSNGKLYVMAMYYGQEKHLMGQMPISSVNSGFYGIDVNTDSAVKLYPYISGHPFLTADGRFYCIADYGFRPRLVNLETRVIVPIE